MIDPLKAYLTLQQATLANWASTTEIVLRSWQHWANVSEQLGRNALSAIRVRPEIDDGPAFTGKYGRRRFDIDPERDV